MTCWIEVWEIKSSSSRVFNFKLVSFAAVQNKQMITIQPVLDQKTQTRVDVSLFLVA